MNQLQIYNYTLYGFLIVAVVTFITLFFITAPYGRHAKKGWGPILYNRTGWILMEAPASLLFLFYFIFTDKSHNATLWAFLIIWQIHYFHRSFIFPFQINNIKELPFSIALFGVLFNTINTYIQGKWVYTFAPAAMYTNEWLLDPRFIIGVFIFAAGYVINKHSDHIIQKLSDPNDPTYKIPYGGMYRFVSCPNYLGELVTWIGWAVMTWSLAGVFFVIWTAANLVPRARSNHKWYLENFSDYPKERKAIFPFIF